LAALALPVAAIVTVVVAAAPLGVTVVGEKLQVASEGSPVQAKLTGWLKPLDGVTVSVVLPEAPAATDIEPGLELSVKLPAGAGAAVPVSEAVCGLPAALSAIEIEAVLLPAAVGWKTTVIVHVALCATDVPQVLVSVKSLEFVPVMLIEVMLSAALPVLDRVIAWLALAVPTVCEANIRLVGARLTFGAVEALPVPVSGTVCGLPVALSATDKLAVSVPVAVGLNSMETAQFALDASELVQVFAEIT